MLPEGNGAARGQLATSDHGGGERQPQGSGRPARALAEGELDA